LIEVDPSAFGTSARICRIGVPAATACPAVTRTLRTSPARVARTGTAASAVTVALRTTSLWMVPVAIATCRSVTCPVGVAASLPGAIPPTKASLTIAAAMAMKMRRRMTGNTQRRTTPEFVVDIGHRVGTTQCTLLRCDLDGRRRGS